MPPDGLHYIEWGYSDNSLRLYSSNANKVNFLSFFKRKKRIPKFDILKYLFTFIFQQLLKVYENLHEGFISSAWFPDTRTLVTGGTDNVINALIIISSKRKKKNKL